MTTRFDSAGLVVTGEDGGERCVPYLAGEMHYWRVPRSSWSACLDQMRALGIQIVATPVPWSVHDRGRDGACDFDGPGLGGFLREVKRADLLCTVLLGPITLSEQTDMGIPERIVTNPEARAITSAGTGAWLPVPPRMVPIPSLAARAFRDAASAWLETCARYLAPQVYPAGPVAAVQLSGAGDLLYRSGAFDLDYHPDALGWWRELAGDREPPRSWSPAASSLCLEWMTFREQYLERAWTWMRQALDEGGLTGLARVHSSPGTEPDQALVPAAQNAIGGPAGLAFHHRASEYRRVRRRALHLAGSAAPLALATSVGLGQAPWLPPTSPGDSLAVLSQLAAAGIRGLSLHMAVERERWYGAAITSQGEAAEPAQRLAQLLAGLRRAGWLSLRRRAPACIVLSRADLRAAHASSVARPLPPILTDRLGLGPAGAAALARDPDGEVWTRWLHAVEDAFDRAGIGYTLVDEQAGDSAWADYRLIVLPTLGRIDRRLLDRLHERAAAGARIVIGPHKPERDQLDRPLDRALPRRVGLMQPGSLTDLAGLARDLLSALPAHERGPVFVGEVPGPGHLDRFEDPSGVVRAIAVGNPDRVDRVFSIDIAPAAGLHDLVSGETLAADGGVVQLACPASGVRLLTVTPTSDPSSDIH